MSGLADADLVLAVIKDSDHLKQRALAHLAMNDVKVPFSVGIELLFVAPRFGQSRMDLVGAMSRHFPIESKAVLFAAAEALDAGEVATVFDAVHASQALLDGTTLHTTDKALLAGPFPTTPF